ncbi:MAG: citrate lyase acyl carrier protein [Clostridium argentinense]|nr:MULTISPECIES: citrate lyase acyl carrier protein [Clostridium]MBS5822512.1 citrate lyase acyl carrier protein [Clostridium argentinense]MDU1347951.1 citrate lyase acyl carrier protein [Clostridium argentinense]
MVGFIMIGIAGNEKSDDVLVKVQLDGVEGITIDIKSKIKKIFGKHMETAIKEALKELNVENAKVELEDFGALDFVIKARVKTAVKRARGDKNE